MARRAGRTRFQIGSQSDPKSASRRFVIPNLQKRQLPAIACVGLHSTPPRKGVGTRLRPRQRRGSKVPPTSPPKFRRIPEPPHHDGHYAAMNATKTFAATLLIAALGAGCSSTSPNTQRGAIGGAVAGAALGGVIGHQSGEAEKGAAIGAAAGGLAGAAVGNQVDRRNERQSEVDRRTTSAVRTPPPTPTSSPRETPPPRPSPDAVWVEGYWSYPGYGDQYQWIAGHWEVPPPGYRTWVGPTWERQSDGTYVYRQGHWR